MRPPGRVSAPGSPCALPAPEDLFRPPGLLSAGEDLDACFLERPKDAFLFVLRLRDQRATFLASARGAGRTARWRGSDRKSPFAIFRFDTGTKSCVSKHRRDANRFLGLRLGGKTQRRGWPRQDGCVAIESRTERVEERKRNNAVKDRRG